MALSTTRRTTEIPPSAPPMSVDGNGRDVAGLRCSCAIQRHLTGRRLFDGPAAYPGVAAINGATGNSVRASAASRPTRLPDCSTARPIPALAATPQASGVARNRLRPGPGAATSGWDSRSTSSAQALPAMDGARCSRPSSPAKWDSGVGSWMKARQPRRASGPHVSDLTGAVPKVPYHFKPITHDYAPVTHAGQRNDIMGGTWPSCRPASRPPAAGIPATPMVA